MSELTSNDRKFKVKYSVAFTKNMGNFQSLRIDLGLEQEGFGSKADADSLLAKTRSWVEDNLGKAVSEVVAEIEG